MQVWEETFTSVILKLPEPCQFRCVAPSEEAIIIGSAPSPSRVIVPAFDTAAPSVMFPVEVLDQVPSAPTVTAVPVACPSDTVRFALPWEKVPEETVRVSHKISVAPEASKVPAPIVRLPFHAPESSKVRLFPRARVPE
ncbi:hypothetical protein ES705_32739 [subsurface metagenome]